MLIASFGMAGCAAEAPSPEPIPVDRVTCARCGMLISSEAGAGEILSASEGTRFYDDIGCLAADWQAHEGGARAFVRLAGRRWEDARTASYARPGQMHTAMGSGIVAFETVAEAQSADRVGHAFTFDELVRLRGEQR